MKHPETALDINGLTKRFDRPAVDGLDLTVRAGEFYTLLGPNGAGKTTTLTPLEYLEFVAGLWSIDAPTAQARAHELIAWLGLTAHAHDRCQGFSRGMRQKVAFAGALVHEPRLLILDEPLTGLDAGSARQVKDVLAERVRGGATVVMTTHILEVAERMAERIGIIDRGRLIAEGTLDELRRHAGATETNLEDIFLDLVGQPEPAG